MSSYYLLIMVSINHFIDLPHCNVPTFDSVLMKCLGWSKTGTETVNRGMQG